MTAQPALDFSGQRENLERVSAKIARLIQSFCAERLRADQPQFHMEELLAYVKALEPSVAPDSPGRILRDLRQRGVIYYDVISRKDSFYELRPVQM